MATRFVQVLLPGKYLTKGTGMISGIIAWTRRSYQGVFIQVDSALTVTCDDIVTLHATLIGDISNKTLLWEQVSGTPVIWLENQDQQTVLFQQPAQRDDKVFRFTLDKGKRTEKWSEILVTAIPTDVFKTSITSQGLAGKYSKSVDITNMSVLLPAFKQEGSQVINDLDRAVLVTAGNLYGIPFTINEYVDGVDATVAGYTFNNPLTGLVYINGLTVDKNYNLRVDNGYEYGVSVYKNHSSTTFNYSPDYAITDENTVATSVPVTNTGLGSIVEVISREIVGNTDSQDSVTLTEGISLVNAGLGSTIEIIERTITVNDESQDTISISNMSLNNSGLTAIVEVKQFQFASLG